MEIDLASMRKLDVRDIDPETLVDISDIRIDLSQPPEQRMASLIQQMNGNPYFFRSEGLIVKTSFKGEARLQTILEDCLEHL